MSRPICSSIARLAAAWALALAAAAPVGAQRIAAPLPTAETRRLTPVERRDVVDSVIAFVERTYVDADTARLIAATVRARRQAGAYDTATTTDALESLLTRDLRAVNHDLHLSVNFEGEDAAPLRRPAARGDAGPGSRPEPEPSVARRRVPGGFSEQPGDVPVRLLKDPRYQSARRRNFGIGRAEVLPGNIGYLEITGFMGAPGMEHAVEDALRLLERTDAMIIDVRRNGGGSGIMSHLVASHFLDATPRATIRVTSRAGTPYTMRSFAKVPGPRRTDVPLYVLTSRFTASAAEEFAFILQNAGRATVVGDRTAGAGHMVESFSVGHGFTVGISVTRVSDPRTGLEWERVGVQPTLRVDADRALDAAQVSAMKALAAPPSVTPDDA